MSLPTRKSWWKVGENRSNSYLSPTVYFAKVFTHTNLSLPARLPCEGRLMKLSKLNGLNDSQKWYIPSKKFFNIFFVINGQLTSLASYDFFGCPILHELHYYKHIIFIRATNQLILFLLLIAVAAVVGNLNILLCSAIALSICRWCLLYKNCDFRYPQLDLKDEKWHHVCISLDQTDPHFSFYFDGVHTTSRSFRRGDTDVLHLTLEFNSL